MITAFGIYAGALAAGGDVGPTPVYGGIKVLSRFNSDGFGSSISEGPFPSATPAFDMIAMECNNIYQRYRVYDPIGLAEITDLIIGGIGDAYAICVSENGNRYGYITPYLKDDEIIPDLITWSAAHTLQIGVDVEAIDFGIENVVYDVTSIQSGRFLAHCIKADASITERILTFYIVDYTSATSHTLTPVAVDLDTLSIDSDLYFDQYDGVKFIAFNRDTDELAVVLNVHSTEFGNIQTVGLNVNQETGAINSAVENINASGSTMSALFPLSEITYACFENTVQYRAGQYDIGSFDSILGHGSSTALQKRTFAGRAVSAGPQIQTEFIDEVTGDTVNIDSAAADKMTALGFAVVDTIASKPYRFAPFFDDMT